MYLLPHGPALPTCFVYVGLHPASPRFLTSVTFVFLFSVFPAPPAPFQSSLLICAIPTICDIYGPSSDHSFMQLCMTIFDLFFFSCLKDVCGPPDLTVPGFGVPVGSAYLSARRTFGRPKVRPYLRPADSAGRRYGRTFGQPIGRPKVRPYHRPADRPAEGTV